MPSATAKSSLTRRIRALYPCLAIRSARLLDAGQYNDVLVVNDEWIFRFPRFQAGVEKLRGETELLHAIGPAITLQIPDPDYVAFEPPVPGQVFAGYRMIAGEPLWRETLARIDDTSTLERFAQQLANFLAELHRLDGADLALAEIRAPDPAALWGGLYERLRERVFPLLSAKSRALVAREFDAFLSDPANLAFQPVLVHGDLGGSNILFDAGRGKITGIIDFGSSHLGDQALDLAALATYGDGFLARLTEFLPGSDALLSRARFYGGTFALQEALYGVEHEDPNALQSGIASYV